MDTTSGLAAISTHSCLLSSGAVRAGSHKILPGASDGLTPAGTFPETPID